MAGRVDGKGLEIPKETTSQASVEGTPAKGGPGGESSGKKYFTSDGPNPGK